MRIVNDQKEPRPTPAVSLLAYFSESLWVGLGFATGLFAPIALLHSHSRFPEPWPKLVAISGAMLSILFLGAPTLFVLVGFVVSLFAADAITRQEPVWRVLTRSVAVAVAIGGLSLFALAQWRGISPLEVWRAGIEFLFASARDVLPESSAVRWEPTKLLLYYEGPFFYVGGVIFAVWTSIGFSAHRNWFLPPHPCSAEELRRLRLPKWFLAVLVAMVASTFVLPPPSWHVAAGLTRVLAILFFCQGTILLSSILATRRTPRAGRLAAYVLAVPAYLLVIALGLCGNWLLPPSPRSLEDHV